MRLQGYTDADLTAWRDGSYPTDTVVTIEDADGTYQDVSDRLIGYTVDQSVDQPIHGARVRLHGKSSLREVVENPEFAGGVTTPWRFVNGAAVVEAGASGVPGGAPTTRVIQLPLSASVVARADLRNATVPSAADRSYRVSAWLAAGSTAAPGDIEVNLGGSFRDAGGSEVGITAVSVEVSALELAGGWLKVVGYVDAPANIGSGPPTAFYPLVFVTTDASAAGSVYVSRVSAEEIGGNLHPLNTASTDNVDSTGTYSPLADPGRGMRVYIQKPAEATPLLFPSDYILVFDGEIDEVNSRGDNSIEVIGRDAIGAELADRWIEAPEVYGGDIPIWSVMQSIIDDHTSGQPDLYYPSDPGFFINQYEQQRQSVWTALQTLADLIGYKVEPRWLDPTSRFELTFYAPRRENPTVDFSHTPDAYVAVEDLSISRLDVRNAVKVSYTDEDGERQSYTATDAASITRYGRRWMEIQEASDSPINTASEAQTMAEAAVSDLAEPEATHAIRRLAFPIIQLGDFYVISANDREYDSDQALAVTGYRHECVNGQVDTVIFMRGKPSSGTRQWLVRADRNPRDTTELPRLDRINVFRPGQFPPLFAGPWTITPQGSMSLAAGTSTNTLYLLTTMLSFPVGTVITDLTARLRRGNVNDDAFVRLEVVTTNPTTGSAQVFTKAEARHNSTGIGDFANDRVAIVGLPHTVAAGEALWLRWYLRATSSVADVEAYYASVIIKSIE